MVGRGTPLLGGWVNTPPWLLRPELPRGVRGSRGAVLRESLGTPAAVLVNEKLESALVTCSGVGGLGDARPSPVTCVACMWLWASCNSAKSARSRSVAASSSCRSWSRCRSSSRARAAAAACSCCACACAAAASRCACTCAAAASRCAWTSECISDRAAARLLCNSPRKRCVSLST